jgi:opacity protein-like surface antigen
MKRFIFAAAAAAALAAPAGASAQEPIWCAHTVEICVNGPNIHIAKQCTTPVMTCVQEAVTKAFNAADNARATAQATADYVIDQIDDPPNVDAVCYAIWGQSCFDAVME